MLFPKDRQILGRNKWREILGATMPN